MSKQINDMNLTSGVRVPEQWALTEREASILSYTHEQNNLIEFPQPTTVEECNKFMEYIVNNLQFYAEQSILERFQSGGGKITSFSGAYTEVECKILNAKIQHRMGSFLLEEIPLETPTFFPSIPKVVLYSLSCEFLKSANTIMSAIPISDRTSGNY